MYILGFDIGGTKIYTTIINENGEIIADINKFETPKTLEGIQSLLKKQISLFEKDVDISTNICYNSETLR